MLVIPGTHTLVVDIGVPDKCVTTPPSPAPAPGSPVIGRWSRLRSCCGDPAGVGLVGWDSLAANCDSGTEDGSEVVVNWSTGDEDIDTMEAAAGDNNEDILDETSTLGDAADDEMDTDETAAKAEYDITINTTTKLRNHQPREKIFLLLNKN